MDSFDQKKTSILREIAGNSQASPDRSPKGTIDHLCVPLIETINAHGDMVTTSSCSGRVSVFLEGRKTSTQIGAKGNGGRWLFVTHEPEQLHGWVERVGFDFAGAHDLAADTRYVLYKFEPLILHVKCRDLDTAKALYTTAVACGFRESGIGSNFIVAIRISIKLDIPIGYLHGEQLVSMVSRPYLDVVTQLSLDRFRENFRKMAQLDGAIKTMQVATGPESREERRLRMIEEGMARRDAVRADKEKKREEKRRQAALQQQLKDQALE